MARRRPLFWGNLLAAAVMAALVLTWPPQDGPLAPLRAAEGNGGEDAAMQTFFTDLEKAVTQGALRFAGADGSVVECPLKHTDVQAEISGFLARVNVTQTFHNPTKEKIEAVYVFPLPHEAAVDRMTLNVGDRKIVGIVKPREEARRVYEQAVAQGQMAALLEQERPNIFTQSVGNLEPGQEVKVTISYVEPLRYDMGEYEFTFPMVVGPRYSPGYPVASPQPRPAELQEKVSPPAADTTRVPDASRINPPVLKPGYRTGHDIRLTVSLDAGVPVQNLTVTSHRAEVKREGPSRATVTLSPSDSVPNKDFVLRYDVVGDQPSLAMLAHTGEHSADAARLGKGYFLLMVQPKEDERLKASPPRELVFLCDVSGSMSGEPTAKVREAMNEMLKLCREKDTVQVITFASQTHKLFPKPVPVTPQNMEQAINFSRQLQGGGGTEMLKGVQLAIDEPVDSERVRIIVMLTDGYIGNEAEIIEHVGKNCGDRVRFWAVGIGSSPNMFLIDGVARQGGGMGKKLGLKDDAAALAQEVMTRIQRAQLANVKIDWGSLAVADTYPARIPELWAGRPIVVYGRYQGGGAATITVRGDVEGEPASWPLEVTLPENEPKHDVLAKVWARQKIEDLMQQDYYQDSPAVKETVTALALDYQLLSQYTSFVAVDEQSESTSDAPRPPRRMLTPVPLPEGTCWEGFFGAPLESAKAGELGSQLGDFLTPAGKELPQLRTFAYQGGRASNTESRTLSPSSGPAPAYTQQFYRPSGGMAASHLGAKMPVQRVPAASDRAYRQLGTQRESWLAIAPQSERLRRATRESAPVRGLLRGAQRDESIDAKNGASVDLDYTGAALQTNANVLVQEAGQALETGKTLLRQEKLADARGESLKAYFLDTAALYRGASTGQTASEALAALDAVNRAQRGKWSKSLPQLERRLNLVIRDKSVTDVLDVIAQAVEVDVRVTPGSLRDAAGLLHVEEPRITYLDLRGATLAQALDWTLYPVRLDWTVANNTINVWSIRRAEGVMPWVYDVSVLALPSREELTNGDNTQKVVERAAQQAESFLQAVRGELDAQGARVEWFAPGQLLVLGSALAHQRMADVVRLLSDDQAAGELSPAALALRATTAKRARDRKASLAEARAAARRRETLAALSDGAWALLASAATGEVDQETLTELQIAWRDAAIDKLAEAKSPGVLIRSWWAIAEAARAVPDDPELQTLAKKVEQRLQPAAERVLQTLQANPSDLETVLVALYAALATSKDSEMRTAVANAIETLPSDVADHAPLRVLAGALLSPDAQPMSGEDLAILFSSELVGEDRVVLTALACHRAGGDAWDAFRRRRQDLVGGQPLPGNVVVLVNVVTGSRLPSAR